MLLDFLALGSDFCQALADECIGSHSAQILALAGTHGNSAVLHIPVADDQHIGDFLHLCFTDLIAKLFTAAVGLGLDVQRVQLFNQLVCVSVGTASLCYPLTQRWLWCGA